MKHLKCILPLIVLGLFGLSSCQEEIITNKGETALRLIASSDSIKCDQRADDQEALQLTWTSGTNQGTGAAIYYYFEMDLKGNNFEGGIKYDIGKTESRVLSFTNKSLTDTLLYYFKNIPLEEYSEFEARITATVAAENVPVQVSPVITLFIAPYKYRVLNVYLIGDATPNGWDNQLATPMIPDYESPELFTWEGMLNAGELKFNTQLGSWYPCYVRDETDPTKMHFREQETDYPDNKWQIETVGTYHIRINIDSLTISITNLDGEVPFDKLYLVGSAAGEAIAMQQDGNDPFIFTYDGTLNAGTFLVSSTQDTEGCAGYQPDQQAGMGSSSIIALEDIGTATFTWTLSANNKYSLRLDLRNMRMDISGYSPYEHIYMIGDATPGGWSWDNVTEMSKNPNDPNEFIYEGPLSQGEIKFPLEIDHSWGGDFILAPTANCAPSENGSYVIGNQPDNKWKISEAGKYRIVINVFNETISFIKQ